MGKGISLYSAEHLRFRGPFECPCPFPGVRTASAAARPTRGALDASLIVLVRQHRPDLFRIEEVFLGHKEAGTTIRLANFRLYTVQESGPEKIDTITPQTRILLFLKPKKEAPTNWEIPGYGYCFFWGHDPSKVAELRKMAHNMVIFRKSWEEARNISDPRHRVEALWPFLWETNARVAQLTSEELKRTAPVAGDYIAERFPHLSDRERSRLTLDAADYGGKNLHVVLYRYLQDLQRRYERILKDRGPGRKPDRKVERGSPRSNRDMGVHVLRAYGPGELQES